MGAVRAYQLNASAVGAAKQMIQESIDILEILVNRRGMMSNVSLNGIPSVNLPDLRHHGRNW